LEAALRELFEETAIPADSVEVIAEHPRWLSYEIPEQYRGRDRGQTQKWFLLRIANGFAPDLARAADREFDAAQWMRPKALTRQVIDFKRDTYRSAIRYFRKNAQI
jgi:putative (di)nucleoside polyphosphate hydrolase